MKGNKSSSARETKHLKEYTRQLSAEQAGYRKFAEARRRNRRFTQEALLEFYDLMVEYVTEQIEAGEPLTIAGCCLAMGIDTSCFYRMKAGDYDGRLVEFMSEHGIDEDAVEIDERGLPVVCIDGVKTAFIPYSELIKKYMLLLQEQCEKRLYSNKSSVNDIFALRSLFGWQDGATVVNDNRQITLNKFASLEEAKDALKRLSE